MSHVRPIWNRILVAAMLLSACAAALAAYKARPWSPKGRENYRAVQSSQGVTIALDPLFRDNLASQVFDKNDMITRGIMPVAVVAFNDNDFPIEINGESIELVMGRDRVRSFAPEQFIPALFKKTPSKLGGLNPIPIPRGAKVDSANADAMDDFTFKFFAVKTILPHGVAGGFLYFRVPQASSLTEQLSSAVIYIPDLTRLDKNTRLMYFEIDLKPALETVK